MDCVFLLQSYLWDIPFLGVILRNMSAYENKGDHEHPFVLPRTTYRLSICGTLSLLSYEVAERGVVWGNKEGERSRLTVAQIHRRRK